MAPRPSLLAFFERSPALVAPELLGWTLRHGKVAVRIVETEAYLGEADPASHAFAGPSNRNRSMFGPPGCCYIYLSYGMHLCLNVVCHEAGQAGGVLIRAGDVISGHALAAERRGRPSDLANGPGRLGQALGLRLDLDGTFLLPDSLRAHAQAAPGPLELEPAEEPVGRIVKGPRVGISKATELPLRFWLEGSRHVSPGRPGPARPKKERRR